MGMPSRVICRVYLEGVSLCNISVSCFAGETYVGML
jgi:hypothetical protein